jgi:choice-of-anchor A domain-containing protein
MKRTLRAFSCVIGTTLCFALPAIADLRSAKNFIVLSAGDSVTFKNRDNVRKPVFPGAVTCPAGEGCTVSIGGTSISVGHDDQIDAQATTLLGDAGADARSFSESLAVLPPTQTLPAIHLSPGASTTISATAGLNVVSVPSIVIGTKEKHDFDHCWAEHLEFSKAQGATLTISASASAFVILNVGTSSAPGDLVLCDGSKVLLAGGITPDKVIFNVPGRSTSVRLGHYTTFNGTILGPQREFTAREGDANHRTLINGAVLVGREAEIGDDADINFYPLSELAVPVTVGVIGTVDVQKLPPAPIRTTTEEADTFLPAPHIAAPAGKPGPPMNSTSLSITKQNHIDVMPGKPGGEDPTLTMPESFLGLGQNGKTPSDTQLAAGRTRLIQMSNITGAFYAKIGGNQTKTFDLGQFFLGNVGQGTDPRVLFDAGTNTYFAAYELHPAGGDDIRLAVAAEPGDQWTVYEVRTNNSNLLFDQPKLGVSDDKIILSWNEYNAKGGFSGADYIVIQKAGVISRAGSVPATIWGPDSSRFQIVPVLSLSSDGGKHYASYHLGGDSNIHLMTFTGVPGVSNVGFSDDSFGIGSVSGPPAASQPAGGDPSITTNDDRLLSAVWQNNRLWGAFNEGCTPQGDRSTRACERFVQLTTDHTGVAQNVQLQSSGQDLYFGAVTLNGNDDLFFGLTFSSSTQDPEAVVLGVPGGSFGAVTGGIAYQSGSQVFTCGCGTNGKPPVPNSRWGDYAGAAREPNDPTAAWVVQQYGGISNPAGGWGTAIALVFFASSPPPPPK